MADIYVATTGNDTTGVGSEANPYATPGKAAGVAVENDVIYVKSGTYTITTSTANIAAGRVELTLGVRMEGYNTTAGDLGTAPVLSAGAVGTISIFKTNGAFNKTNAFVNLKADGNSQTSTIGFEINGTTAGQVSGFAHYCQAVNCTTRGFYLGNLTFCSAEACAVGFYQFQAAVACRASDCTSHGFDLIGSTTQNRSIVGCLADGNGGSGFRTYFTTSVVNCTAHGNTSDGFNHEFDNIVYANCLATSNGGYGFNANNTARPAAIIKCAGLSNTSGNTHSADAFLSYGFVSLTADPYTNAAVEDFSLNNTAGGGAACRAAGIPGAYPGGATTGYLDIGAAQHADPAGGSGGGLRLAGRGGLAG